MGDEGEVRGWEQKAVTMLLSALTAGFLAWAGVVWSGTEKLSSQMARISDQLAADRLEQQVYRSQMERRLTIVEERQARIIRVLETNAGIAHQ